MALLVLLAATAGAGVVAAYFHLFADGLGAFFSKKCDFSIEKMSENVIF